MSDTSKDLLLPKGSTILVTGASGYIGAHVVNEALKLGYKVRGTARSQEKAENTKKIFDNNPNYSAVVVEDLQHDGAFDAAVKGVDSIIHVASDTTLSTDPEKVIGPMIAGVNSILTSAMNESTVKSVVLTSSSSAASFAKPGKKFHISTDTWNDEAYKIAMAPPPYEDIRPMAIYAASKVEGERAFWKFAEEKKPHFAQNAILPNFNMGTVISQPGPTGSGVIEAYQGKRPAWDPQYMINVVDNARVHLIAAIDSTVKNERIFTFNVPFNWNDVLGILRKIRPNAKIMDDISDEPRDLSTVDNQRGAELLKKWFDQDGWTSLEQSVKDNIAHL